MASTQINLPSVAWPVSQQPFGPPALTDFTRLWGPFAPLAGSHLSEWRSMADAFLYPAAKISEADRRALFAARVANVRADDAAIVVVRPNTLRVHRSLARMRASDDALARIAALPAPGAGLVGAAGFAREVAKAFGEPVLTWAPSYDLADATAEMMGVLSPLLNDDGAALVARPEARTLRALVDGAAPALSLVVGHGVGAWVAARTLAKAPPERSRRVISFGAAPANADHVEVISVIGAADLYGWSLTDIGAHVWDAPAASGHHLNPIWPGAINVADTLRRIEKDEPFLNAARPKAPTRLAIAPTSV